MQLLLPQGFEYEGDDDPLRVEHESVDTQTEQAEQGAAIQWKYYAW